MIKTDIFNCQSNVLSHSQFFFVHLEDFIPLKPPACLAETPSSLNVTEFTPEPKAEHVLVH